MPRTASDDRLAPVRIGERYERCYQSWTVAKMPLTAHAVLTRQAHFNRSSSIMHFQPLDRMNLRTLRSLTVRAAAFLLLVGCSFSKGTKKDLVTGLTTSYNGFAVDNISLVGDGDKALSSSEVALNSKFAIVFQGIANYTLKNEKAFPGLSILVTDSKGAAVMKEADLLAGSADGYSSVDASVLRGTIVVGSPMEAGQSYHCKIRVFDKNSPESEIVSELDFTVK